MLVLPLSKRASVQPSLSAHSYLRQRKDRLGGIRYSTLIMKDILAISETTVADLLAATPMAVRFFIDQGTGCAICSLARFCKLKEVVTAYDLSEEVFLEELAKLNVHKL
jgi:hypothetical protein